MFNVAQFKVMKSGITLNFKLKNVELSYGKDAKIGVMNYLCQVICYE